MEAVTKPPTVAGQHPRRVTERRANLEEEVVVGGVGQQLLPNIGTMILCQRRRRTTSGDWRSDFGLFVCKMG
jgi:hypothetical protein